MKDVFLVYDRCCFYEIVILSYFLNFAHCDLAFCSLDGRPICAMKGGSVHADAALKELDKDEIRSLIVPGGGIAAIDTEAVWTFLRSLKKRNVLIAGICAGVDVLDHAGVLCGVRSTHSSNEDIVSDKQVITARANTYVDFAIETAKKLSLLADEADLQQTIGFWKQYHRVQ